MPITTDNQRYLWRAIALVELEVRGEESWDTPPMDPRNRFAAKDPHSSGIQVVTILLPPYVIFNALNGGFQEVIDSPGSPFGYRCKPDVMREGADRIIRTRLEEVGLEVVAAELELRGRTPK